MVNTIHLLLDQGLPRGAADYLRAMGFDCVHVGDLGMASASDDSILDLARDELRVVVTLDWDFPTFLAVSGDTGPSVVRIRVEGLGASSIATLIGRWFSNTPRNLAREP